MGRKAKYSEEIKIKACKDYDEGNFSFNDIAKMIGTAKEVVRRWYLKYKEHGSSVFKASNKQRLYSKEFKLTVIQASISGKLSQSYLAAKYNITTGLVSNWVNKWYNGIEIKGYYTKGDVYIMKPRKTTFEERLDIAKWVIANDMDYKAAAEKYSISYARIYKWTTTYINEGEGALESKKRGPKPRLEIDENDLTEIEKLKLELEKEKSLRERSELELEVLKKKEEFEKELHYQKLGMNQNTRR